MPAAFPRTRPVVTLYALPLRITRDVWFLYLPHVTCLCAFCWFGYVVWDHARFTHTGGWTFATCRTILFPRLRTGLRLLRLPRATFCSTAGLCAERLRFTTRAAFTERPNSTALLTGTRTPIRLFLHHAALRAPVASSQPAYSHSTPALLRRVLNLRFCGTVGRHSGTWTFYGSNI